MERRSRIYNIPAGVSFVDAFAEGLLRRYGERPEDLARVEVLLPTRRAVRALREAFLRRSGGRALLLPSMRPLGDVDDEELGFGDAAWFDLQPALPPLERQLLLMRLIRRLPDFADPAQAAKLARELARFLDEIIIERKDFGGLQTLVPADYAEHWQQTLTFLSIVTTEWPKVLERLGLIEAASRRNRLLEAQAAKWQNAPPSHAVYAAGSTGSLPASADLLRVVASLPDGALVLPGLDLALGDAAWDAVAGEPTHPQYGLHRLLDHLGVTRADVANWPTLEGVEERPARARLISQALLPADATAAWSEASIDGAAACRGLVRIDAPGAEEEAGVIALLLREALETPGRTAALVTPDRQLARRVAADLRRYDIEIDDSAGTPLSQTLAGAFLRLIAEMFASDFAPVPFLAACKHPFAAASLPHGDFRRRVRLLERICLRGARPAPGIDGLLQAVADCGLQFSIDLLSPFLLELRTKAVPLAALGDREWPIPELLRLQIGFAEWFASSTSGLALWSGEAGEAAAGFVSDLLLAGGEQDCCSLRAWPALLDELMSGVDVRPRYGKHPRLAIWGPLEARLQQADLLILGGLNEGTWPADVGNDPWLNRPMRQAFGLPPPERRIGLAAHDFQQAANARDVVLCRTEKRDGAETVPSRWLLRLETLLQGQGIELDRSREAALLSWQRLRDQPAGVLRIGAPAPRPPLHLRPRRLAVTQIEQWLRDPYAIFARHILKLRKLPPLDEEPGARDRGIIIHAALDRFVNRYPRELPPDAQERLIEIGRQSFAPYFARPGVRAFWWPRFLRIVDWFLELERERRAAGAVALLTETRGEISIEAAGGPFSLHAIADRIDETPQGLVILDYKTGLPPTAREVEVGLSPQLPLEAAIARAGGFAGLPPRQVAELVYLRLSGSRLPGEYRQLGLDVEATAATALARLKTWVSSFDRLQTPYLSRPRPKFVRDGGDYDDLARVHEWSAVGAEE